MGEQLLMFASNAGLLGAGEGGEDQNVAQGKSVGQSQEARDRKRRKMIAELGKIVDPKLARQKCVRQYYKVKEGKKEKKPDSPLFDTLSPISKQTALLTSQPSASSPLSSPSDSEGSDLFVRMKRPFDTLLASLREQGKRSTLTGKQQEQLKELVEQEEVKRRNGQLALYPVDTGLSFSAGPQDSLLQLNKITQAGRNTLRISLSQTKAGVWLSKHKVFVGVTYTVQNANANANNHHNHKSLSRNSSFCSAEGFPGFLPSPVAAASPPALNGGVNPNASFCGFVAGASPYLGIFELQALTAASSRPEPPLFVTGSAAKLELDLDMTSHLTRVNAVVSNVLQVQGGTLSQNAPPQIFQCSRKTLEEGLRFVIIPIGVEVDEEIEVRLNWVSL